MWLPVYDRSGHLSGRTSNIVYSIDLVRGLDVYVVDVPGDGIGATPTPGVTRGSDSPLSLSSVLPAGSTDERESGESLPRVTPGVGVAPMPSPGTSTT